MTRKIVVGDREFFKYTTDWWIAVDDVVAVGSTEFVTRSGDRCQHDMGTPGEFLTSMGGVEVLHG